MSANTGDQRCATIPVSKEKLILVAAYILLPLAMIVALRLMGRVWWCACGGWELWNGEIWSSHTSQHLLDHYSFTHVLHGVLLCGIICWLFPRMSMPWRLWLALLVETAWEVIENTPFIIQRYREATIDTGYEGDSIINSGGDLLACAAGFFIAKKLGFKLSVVFFIIVEAGLLLWIRDNLTLNVIMLLYPFEAIKEWQMAG